MWALLVADYGISPSEAWNTTPYEYFWLHDVKYAEVAAQQGKKRKLTRDEAQELRAALDAEIAKERRNGSRG